MSKQMQAAVLEGSHKITIHSLPQPTATSADEVVAQVRHVGLCRTDFQLSARGEDKGLVMGHEVVCQIPGDSGYYALNNEVSCGQCSYCQQGFSSHCENLWELGINAPGGYAQWLLTPRRQLYPLTFSNPVLGTLVEPLSCAIHAEQRLQTIVPMLTTTKELVVFIVGGGISGALLSYLVSQWSSSPKLLLHDIAETEFPWMEALDIERITEPPEQAVHLSIECSGSSGGRQTAFRAVRKGGAVCLYGVPNKQASLPISADELFQRELIVLTSFAGATDTTVKTAIKHIHNNELFFSRLIGRIIPLQGLPKALTEWSPIHGTRTVMDTSI